jgi:hypothetical protein
MSDTASSAGLGQRITGRRIGWSCEFILLLLVLASRPGPTVALSASYFIAGVLEAEVALVLGFAVLAMPVAAMLAVIARLVTCWSRARLSRRLMWIGMILLAATATCAKRAPWVPLALNTYVSKALPSERAYLYGFSMRLRCCVDIPAIRAWARDYRGLYVEDMSDAFAAGRVPHSVKWLRPSCASVEAADSAAVFEGTMVFLPERWVLVICQEEGRVPDSGREPLRVAPGVWLTWAGQHGGAP